MGGPGSGGANRKSGTLHIVHGTFDKRRHREQPATTPTSPPRVPAGLSSEARKFWRSITGEWELDPADLVVLGMACEALGRLREAQAAISADGLLYTTGKGRVKRVNPAVGLEKDARTALLAALRQLGLEDER